MKNLILNKKKYLIKLQQQKKVHGKISQKTSNENWKKIYK